MQKVFYKTFGCRTNQFDTQVMINNTLDFEVVDNESLADIVVINSCTVTNGADSNVRNYINKLSGKKLFFTGCGVASQGKQLFEQNKVNSLFGHSLKKDINTILSSDRFYNLGDINYIDNEIVSDYIGKSRAFIKIQEGCDFSCSYCIIPSTRGFARSLDGEKIIEQIKILAGNGFKEFILTGTNVGSYKTNTISFVNLLKQIGNIHGVKRLRVGSLEPSQIGEEFIELLDETWMAKHLHIAIQHSSDKMLEIMNRQNRVKSDIALFEKIASKNIAIGTDFIVGHPFESEDVWREAFDNIKHYPLTHIHPFSYSKRDGTKSSRLTDVVPNSIAKERLIVLKDIIKEKNYDFRKSHFLNLQILVESFDNGFYVGYDQYFNKNKIKSTTDIRSLWIDSSSYEIKKGFNEHAI